MNHYPIRQLVPVAVVILFVSAGAGAQDWPQWGRDASKNMTAPDARGIPSSFDPGRIVGHSETIDPATTHHIKWIAKLGSQSYGNVTVSGGCVFIGTNNASPRDPKLKGDRSNIYCLDEHTGEFLWQLSTPKLGAGKISDWEYLGICSSPTVEGNRVYVVTNRCQVIALDVGGMADGNDGPFTSEGPYMTAPGKPAITPGSSDGDIVWVYDMAEELGVFPHNITSSSILLVGDHLYVTTSNGVDYSHKHITNPRAPALIVLDKATGKLVGEEASGLSNRLFHSNWSSPAFGQVAGKGLIFYGAGDGFCYAFDTRTVRDAEGFDLLKEIWRVDCNPPQYRSKDGKPLRYASTKGPSEIIATPVFAEGRVYVAIGQDPEHGEGVGALNCIDATGKGDISQSGLLWRYTDINRSLSTVSVVDGLVYITDYAGVVHCLDSRTGKLYWKHDTFGHIWSSTLVADGKLFITNEDGILTIIQAGKRKKVIGEIEFAGPIYSSPIVANNVLYIATMTHLYAIEASRE